MKIRAEKADQPRLLNEDVLGPIIPIEKEVLVPKKKKMIDQDQLILGLLF